MNLNNLIDNLIRTIEHLGPTFACVYLIIYTF